MHLSFTEMHLLWANDGQHLFEIETNALAHVACAPQESGVLLTDFAAAYPSVNHSWISLRDREDRIALPFSFDFCEVFTATASHTWNSREQYEDNSLWPEEYDKVVLRVVTLLQWPLTRSSDGSKSQLSQGTPTTWNSCSLHNALTLTISLWLHHSLSEDLMTALAPAFRSVDSIAGLNVNYRKCLLGSLWHRRKRFSADMDLGELRGVP